MYEKNHFIIEVAKDSKGEIVGYKLDNGKVLSKEEAVELAEKGEIKGVLTAKSKLGEKYLRSIPDGSAPNNLENLPVMDEDELK